MRSFPIILTLILVAVWGYTSWYWYTCKIKGFCDDRATYVSYQSTQDQNLGTTQDSFIIEDNIDTEDLEPVVVDTPSDLVTSNDTLFENTQEDESDEDTPQNPQEVGGDTEQQDPEFEASRESFIQEVSEIEENLSSELCEKPIVGPVGFGRANNKAEVERLESFLLSQGYNVTLDGFFGKDDESAIKNFQTTYRSEILDPWGIQEPTGYVFKTTVKKINAIACPSS